MDSMPLEQIIILIIAIITVIILIWRFILERPRLKVEVLSCKHRVRSDNKATNVKLEFRVYNSGNKATTLTKLEVAFSDWKGNPRTATENLKIDVEGSKTTDKLEVLFTFYPTFQYAELFPCTFTLHHTQNRLSFEANSQESSKDLSGKAPLNAWRFG